MRVFGGLILLILAIPAMCTADFWLKGGAQEVNAEFHIAAWNGDLTAMRRMIDQGVDVNTFDGTVEDTPLAGAACAGNEGAVKLLLENGADVNLANSRGWTPAMWAAAVGRDKTLAQIIKAGGNLAATNESGQTALMIAAGNGQLATVKILLAAGCPRDTKNDAGETAYSIARSGKHFACARQISPNLRRHVHT